MGERNINIKDSGPFKESLKGLKERIGKTWLTPMPEPKRPIFFRVRFLKGYLR